MTDEDAPLEYFTEAELAALGELLIAMLRVDGQASDAEQAALRLFAKRVRLGARPSDAAPYRAQAGEDGIDGLTVLGPHLDRAAAKGVSREDFVRAAGAITRQEAREAIYAALFDVSAADVIVGQEWELLKVLVDAWNIEPV
jgi:hypothetical protein